MELCSTESRERQRNLQIPAPQLEPTDPVRAAEGTLSSSSLWEASFLNTTVKTVTAHLT